MKAVQDGPTSILVSWSPSSDATGYRIQYVSEGSNSSLNVSGGSTNNNTLTGLTNGNIYGISIIATSDGISSETVTVHMPVSLGKSNFFLNNNYVSILCIVCSSWSANG